MATKSGSSPVSLVVTTTQANSWVHDVITFRPIIGETVGADQTERWLHDFGFASYNAGGSTEETTSTGDVTMSWTWTVGTTNSAHVAAEIKEKVAGGTDMELNISDAWKDVDAIQINIGDTWKEVSSAKINISDTWKTIF